MDLVAAILWSGFQLSMIALIAGLIAQHRRRRGLALTLFSIAVLGTLVFSFVGGFSIGRFTAAIPVLLSGYVFAMGRGPIVMAASVLGAGAIYLALSWLLTPLAARGDPITFVFGFWAIPVYAILALLAFGWAVAKPPHARIGAAN